MGAFEKKEYFPSLFSSSDFSGENMNLENSVAPWEIIHSLSHKSYEQNIQ